MRATIQYIEKELTGLYPEFEIKGLVRLILEAVCGLNYTGVILNPDKEIPANQKKKIQKITQRLKSYEPIQYILGETEFYGLQIKVNPGVLIPRQETEELVDWIIKSNSAKQPKILDIGTGSGCIVLALKKTIPGAQVFATDISEAALQTAKQNAVLNQLDVNFIQSDILNYPEKQWQNFDIIVSNPPYVREKEKAQMKENVLNFEPGSALFVPDDDPLVYYRMIARFAREFLRVNGYLYFEINENFSHEMNDLCSGMGFRDIKIEEDINGKPRILRCKN